MMVEAADWAVMETESSGTGAARPPVATVGMQEALMECWLEQFPEQEHCAGDVAPFDVDSSCNAAGSGDETRWPAWPDASLPDGACPVVSGIPPETIPLECAEWVPVMTCMPRIPAMMARTAARSEAVSRAEPAMVRCAAMLILLPACLLFLGYRHRRPTPGGDSGCR